MAIVATNSLADFFEPPPGPRYIDCSQIPAKFLPQLIERFREMRMTSFWPHWLVHRDLWFDVEWQD